MMIDDLSYLISIMIGGGTYYYTRDANVVLIVDDFTGLDKFVEPLIRVAMNAKCTLLAFPNISKETYGKSPLKDAVDDFLRKNMHPSFIFCTRVYPELIMDKEICIVKEAIKDHDGLLKKIIGIGFEWFLVKDDEAGSDTTSVINSDIQREWELLSSTLLVSENAMDHLFTLLTYLRENKYAPVESGI